MSKKAAWFDEEAEKKRLARSHSRLRDRDLEPAEDEAGESIDALVDRVEQRGE